MAALPLVLVTLLAGCLSLRGAEGGTADNQSSSSAAPNIILTEPASPGDLDRAIDEVLERREFTWRMPRETLVEETTEGTWLQETLRRVFDWIAGVARSVGRTISEIMRWLLDALFGQDRPRSQGGSGWTDATRGLFILLLIALAGAIGYLIYRLWRNRQQQTPEVAAQAAAVPDLDDDNLTAAQLPEDEWLRLAREMIAKGAFRLARLDA
jgi:hypothetical protein